MRLLVAHGASIGRRASPAELVELGCGNGQKLAALVRAMAPAAAGHSSDRRVARGAGPGHPSAARSERCTDYSRSWHVRGWTDAPAGDAAAPAPADPLPGVEHRELRSARGVGVSACHAASGASRRLAAAWRRPGEARTRPDAGVRRSARGHRCFQQESPSAPEC